MGVVWSRRTLAPAVAFVVAAAFVAACDGSTETPQPPGYPLNACPSVGSDAVVARSGFQLVVPGEVAFAYTEVQSEDPPGHECGAQSVKGAKLTIRRGEIAGNLEVAFAATLTRAVPLAVPEPMGPRLQLFRIDDAGPALLETVPIQLAEQYRATGTVLPGAPVGRYRMTIVSQANEILAEGTFTIVE